MKLPQLLSHYLYKNKTLSLPGLGVFTLDASTEIPSELDANNPQEIKGIQFESKNILHSEPSLIDFIHQYTGKMRPLAESDLDSYLSLGIQLINIGKPFHLEGIGSVYRTAENKFDFHPGEFSHVKLTLPEEEQVDNSEKRKTNHGDSINENTAQPASARKVFLVLGILGGLVLIGWGGYNLYKKKISENNSDNNISIIQQDSSAKKDSIAAARLTDSLNKTAKTVSHNPTDSSQYKFVILGTKSKKRAESRYNQLMSFTGRVKMQAKDSSFYQVYFTIMAAPKDTLRIKDSLNAYYATKTVIEQ